MIIYYHNSLLYTVSDVESQNACPMAKARFMLVHSCEIFSFYLQIAAAEEGHTKIVELLIQHGANIEAKNASGATPLWSACRNGRREVVELLLHHKANPNATATTRASTPLLIAATYKHPEIIELLKSAGADVKASKSLYTPGYYDTVDVLKLLDNPHYVPPKKVAPQNVMTPVSRRSSCILS
jgi:ankyrin repeat protein